MKKAEDRLNEVYPNLDGSMRINIIAMIKATQKDAIEECAKRAKARMIRLDFIGMVPAVDEQSILSLISEIE
jgi:hypothetical protein